MKTDSPNEQISLNIVQFQNENKSAQSIVEV